VANRALTFVQNLLIGQKLSEYHTGYRAFSLKVLETLPLLANSDDFIFDNQMLVQCHHWGFRIGEISCPARYFPEASTINFRRSVRYGLGTLKVSVDCLRRDPPRLKFSCSTGPGGQGSRRTSPIHRRHRLRVVAVAGG
jgi:hypothetical protein